MILSFDQLQSLIHGAIRFDVNSNGIMPLRYTLEQAAYYSENPSYADKVYAAASMRIEMMTDAEAVSMDYDTRKGSGVNVCYFDAYKDGIMIYHFGTDDRTVNPRGTLNIPLQNDFPGTKNAGLHHFSLYLPNLCGVRISRFELTGASVAEPVPCQDKMLVFGDSITQGYTSRFSSLTYVNRIQRALGCDVVNKAVGGDTFMGRFAAMKDDFSPKSILTAYGTNDWGCKNRDTLIRDTQEYFRNVSANYPDAPHYVILPLWRADWNHTTDAGSFEDVREIIRSVCKNYPRIRVIDGMTLVPHLPDFFADGSLHPNDAGFVLMAEEILRVMKP